MNAGEDPVLERTMAEAALCFVVGAVVPLAVIAWMIVQV